MIDASRIDPVSIAILALQLEPGSPPIRSPDIANNNEFSAARTSRSSA